MSLRYGDIGFVAIDDGSILGGGMEFFSEICRYEMGDGTKIRFWYDLCCGDQPLKDFFPELFSIARCKEVWVTIKIAVSNGNI